MGPQKFVASNTAEALKMVKAKMGPGAMVLSTKDTDEGVEVTAITPEDLSQLSNQSSDDRVQGSGSSASLRTSYRNSEDDNDTGRFSRDSQASVRVPPKSVELGRSSGARSSGSEVSPISIADALQKKKRSQKM